MDSFSDSTYIGRRQHLVENLSGEPILLIGNQDAPVNFRDNPYPFRQDSTFLYFIGLDLPGLAALYDPDPGSWWVFGNDVTIEQAVWTGPRPTLMELCQAVGIRQVANPGQLCERIQAIKSSGRQIHFLPTYRAEQTLILAKLLQIAPEMVEAAASVRLIKAVVAQRSIKSPQEIGQIEAALQVSARMHEAARGLTRPGLYERQVVCQIEAIARSEGLSLAFPTIFSVRGEILHNPYYDNLMQPGQMVVHDSGVESRLHYASDITRTIPVSGRFTDRQREIYRIVLATQQQAIAAIRPGVEFRTIHRLACRSLLAGLKDLGLVRGDIDEAVEAGAHTLFFQCGLGHMLGLDVHDMEALGEDYVGYTDQIRRNPAFGWRSLRLARALEAGFVLTVEPGIYFIDQLIDRFKAEGRFASFIDYQKIQAYRGMGGIRIEDDVLVTPEGCRVLGPPIPKHIDDIEC